MKRESFRYGNQSRGRGRNIRGRVREKERNNSPGNQNNESI